MYFLHQSMHFHTLLRFLLTTHCQQRTTVITLDREASANTPDARDVCFTADMFGEWFNITTLTNNNFRKVDGHLFQLREVRLTCIYRLQITAVFLTRILQPS